MASTTAAAARRPFNKQEFYRYCRLVHGWLSAVAFLVLVFFSFTGLLLNHPGWLSGEAPPTIEEKFTLEQQELEALLSAQEPEQLLPEMVAKRVDLKGAMTGGNQVRNDVFVRMQGVQGLSDLRANLTTGEVEVIVEPAPTISILNELHRGERAGTAWRLLIDVVAIVLIVMSIVGYLIFMSLRFRLRTALILTAVSTIGIYALFAVAVA